VCTNTFRSPHGQAGKRAGGRAGSYCVALFVQGYIPMFLLLLFVKLSLVARSFFHVVHSYSSSLDSLVLSLFSFPIAANIASSE
jgi:hypothetical protein